MIVRPPLSLPATKTAACLRRSALLVIAVVAGIAAPVPGNPLSGNTTSHGDLFAIQRGNRA